MYRWRISDPSPPKLPFELKTNLQFVAIRTTRRFRIHNFKFWNIRLAVQNTLPTDGGVTSLGERGWDLSHVKKFPTCRPASVTHSAHIGYTPCYPTYLFKFFNASYTHANSYFSVHWFSIITRRKSNITTAITCFAIMRCTCPIKRTK